jgi:hypothetical protein
LNEEINVKLTKALQQIKEKEIEIKQTEERFNWLEVQSQNHKSEQAKLHGQIKILEYKIGQQEEQIDHYKVKLKASQKNKTIHRIKDATSSVIKAKKDEKIEE